MNIYVNKIENRITFKIKTRYFLELLTPERQLRIKTDQNSKLLEIEDKINIILIIT